MSPWLFAEVISLTVPLLLEDLVLFQQHHRPDACCKSPSVCSLFVPVVSIRGRSGASLAVCSLRPPRCELWTTAAGSLMTLQQQQQCGWSTGRSELLRLLNSAPSVVYSSSKLNWGIKGHQSRPLINSHHFWASLLFYWVVQCLHVTHSCSQVSHALFSSLCLQFLTEQPRNADLASGVRMSRSVIPSVFNNLIPVLWASLYQRNQPLVFLPMPITLCWNRLPGNLFFY